ncbi:DUF4279 domain-containing protein [Lentzea sp. BCCO 10_0798]|uniref:DUF4279 domain-containing protein n=1 Tax=Lentzea kristufekii TaxID=3095430 RepID=A0ABU4U2D5_9PSEU|nr:DUF4279 domain-containing protein [Lentzea sp. BCCO 10_0798]MDX8054729.1 DUF4279 domain-containing protein [Lentzea sp. BCCO 10_0798]
MSAFRVYLRVQSADLLPEQISEQLGVESDESHAAGSRKWPGAAPRRESTWIRRAEATEAGGRPEHVEPVILGWGLEFARKLGLLVESSDAVVSLEIVQKIRDLDDTQAKGIFLSADLMAWLGVAKSSLDIDQYILHECDEPREGVQPGS